MIKTKEYEYCLRCGRKLKSVETRRKGSGIVCEKKMRVKHRKKLL